MTGRERVEAAAKCTDLIEEHIRLGLARAGSRRAINALGVYMELDNVDLAISIAIGHLRAAENLIRKLRRARPTEADYDQM